MSARALEEAPSWQAWGGGGNANLYAASCCSYAARGHVNSEILGR